MTGASELVDVAVPLPEPWTFHQLGDDDLAATQDELVTLLDGKVDDPRSVAADAMAEFLERIGAGSRPMLLASVREDLGEERILAISLIVTRNELGGSLDPWRDAFQDAEDLVEVTVLDEPAVRIASRAMVDAGDLFEEPLQVVTWRYVVPFDDRSVLVFAFSTPNHELDEILLEHVEMIMSGVSISLSEPASGENPANADSTASN